MRDSHITKRGQRIARACRAVAAMLVLAGCETIPDELPELTLNPVPVLEPAPPGTVDLAEQALRDGRYLDAQKLLERVLVGDQKNARAKLIMAELRLATRQTQRAAVAFSGLVEDPEYGARALQGQGIALMLLGENEAGFESLGRAVELDHGLWRAWNGLGFYYDSQGDWAAAVDSYDKALAGNPDSAVIYNNRGFSMLMQGRYEEAADDLNKALRLDPDLGPARENLRLALAWQGKYLRAISGAGSREMGKVLNNVGFIALLRGDYENAEAYLLRAMEVDPRFNDVASRNLAYLKSIRDIQNAETPRAQY